MKSIGATFHKLFEAKSKKLFIFKSQLRLFNFFYLVFLLILVARSDILVVLKYGDKKNFSIFKSVGSSSSSSKSDIILLISKFGSNILIILKTRDNILLVVEPEKLPF